MFRRDRVWKPEAASAAPLLVFVPTGCGDDHEARSKCSKQRREKDFIYG